MRNLTAIVIGWTVFALAVVCCEKVANEPERAVISQGYAELDSAQVAVMLNQIAKSHAQESLQAAQLRLSTVINECQNDINALKQKPSIRAGSSLEVLHGPPQ